ncbi:hypothetical protein CAOG_06764 [Capsaspora owczarzaki ATCC 30864]|uniref:hypothetical protein n=1 Tax=Capsaspora owczarzaki (strain ATCC 30864) TaxID=595528 RepID=UPI0003523A74|nr:hypothetical protein CAOG_06764 [Capsaspora owczarzaki ATCC 30864]|eukprot:XP_004344385.2 hypothetical protein CAOG_06764 [Capsaspora owczarzaki ATCC 30864]
MANLSPTSVAAVAASSQAQAQAASSPPRQPAPAAAAATAPTTPATTAPSTAGATTTTAAAAPAASVTLSVSIAATAAAAAALPSPLESLLPPEIVARPVPLVALVGVEAVEGPFPRVSLQEAIHSERLVEQIPVTYRPVSKDVLLLLPQRKERRDVESYSPPGILKGSWIHKHRQVIPAVAAYFVELEWDDPQWAACEQECAAVFDKLRQSTAGRATRHVLVLVQRKHDRPMPPLFVDERSNSMRRACQIPLVLSLSFAKPDLPAIKQNVAKLEKALIDMAYAYYRDEAKRLKQRKERLNKSLQQGMLARLFFKLAYFAEMRSDGKAAIKYYGSSYAYLKELAERDKNGMAAAMRASIVGTDALPAGRVSLDLSGSTISTGSAGGSNNNSTSFSQPPAAGPAAPGIPHPLHPLAGSPLAQRLDNPSPATPPVGFNSSVGAVVPGLSTVPSVTAQAQQHQPNAAPFMYNVSAGSAGGPILINTGLAPPSASSNLGIAPIASLTTNPALLNPNFGRFPLAEVKAVAGLINYKLCRLHFMFNFADALDQFRKHVANYRGIVGRPELAFEHSAWLGRQYRVFAELFENALAYNLVPTTQSQHPGFYYRQAAVHAMDEKAHAAVQCASVKPLFDQLRASAPAASSTASSADPRGRAGSLVNALPSREEFSIVEYYGHLPKVTNTSTLCKTEEDSTVLKAILASSDEDRRKLAELLVDHSGLIITLLSMAREHFKKMRSARMTLHMAVHIAQEYCQAGEHERALKLFERIAVDYRKERWWPVLESVLTASLACAYLIGSVQDFVVLSLELIASLTKHAPQRSIRAQESLMRVLSNQVPFPPEPSELVLMPLALNDTPPSLPAAAGSVQPPFRGSLASPQALAAAGEKWTALLNKPEHVDMGLAGVIPFIECKVIFAAPTSPSDAPVVMHLAVVSRCPLAVEGSRLNLKFNVPGYAVSIVNETDRAQASAVRDAARTKSRSASIASEGARRRHETQVFDLAVPFVDQDTSIPTTIAADLTFSPDQPKLFRLQFLPLDNSDRTLECIEASIVIGSAQRSVTLRFNILERIQRALQAAPTHWTTAELERTPWPELVERPSTKIATRESQMDISITHTPPALVNEFYPVKLVFTSREKLPIYNVSVHLEFLQHRDATQGWTSDGSICLTPELAKGESYRTRTIALEKMEPEASQEQLVYLFSPKDIGEQILTVKMSYSVDAVADGKRMFACTCQKEHLLRVPFVLPFTLLVKLATAKFEPIDVKLDSVSPRDALLLTTETQSVTPWPISIVKTELIVDTKALRLEGALPRNEPTSLNQGDTMSESFALRVGNPSVASISLGYYKIHWLRRDRNPMLADQGGVQSDPSPSVTAIALPPVNVAYKAISIVPQIPASGHLNSPLEVSYAIVNHTPLTQEIELVMESNESFMFSGLKATHFRVLPSASTSVTYNLYPLQPGRLPLPHLSVKSVRQDAELTFRAMPEHVFILPPRPTNAPAADLAR